MEEREESQHFRKYNHPIHNFHNNTNLKTLEKLVNTSMQTHLWWAGQFIWKHNHWAYVRWWHCYEWLPLSEMKIWFWQPKYGPWTADAQSIFNMHQAFNIKLYLYGNHCMSIELMNWKQYVERRMYIVPGKGMKLKSKHWLVF